MHVSIARNTLEPKLCIFVTGCGVLVAGDELRGHLSSECPKRVVPCPLGCSEPELWAEEVESHCHNDCPLHVEECRMGCGEQVAASAREVHEASDCAERMVQCECGTEHTFSKTEDHRC